MSTTYMEHIDNQTINGVHYKENKKQEFVKFLFTILIGNLPKFSFAKLCMLPYSRFLTWGANFCYFARQNNLVKIISHWMNVHVGTEE